METHSQTSVYYTGIEFFGGKQGEYKVNYVDYPHLLLGNSITCCCIVKKNEFEQISGFDENLHGYEDWDFFIRLLYVGGNVYKNPELLFHYRMGVNMDSISKQAKRNKDVLANYIYNKNQAIYIEYYGGPLQVLFDMIQYRNENQWYKEIISHPIAKLGFRLQIVIDRLFTKILH